MRRLRIATYNVHKCRGLDGRLKPGRIAEVIGEIEPDVIGLQEVLSLEGGTRELHQAEFLAEELGMSLAIGEVRKLRGGIYGNIVLSRLPLTSVCSFDLSVPGREQRGCLRTDVALPTEKVLHVFNVHLGTDFRERQHQAKRLLAAELIRSESLEGPRVVLGDFNEWVRGLVSRLLANEFSSADIRLLMRQRMTYPGVLPFLHLDHIYYDHDLVVENVALHKSRKALIASDHLPLYADFSLKEDANLNRNGQPLHADEPPGHTE